MKRNIFICFFFYLFSVFIIFSKEDKQLYVNHKVTLVKPSTIFFDTIEKIFINETISTLEIASKNHQINYIEEILWNNNSHLLQDLTNTENLKFFYLNTDIDILLLINIEELDNDYLIELNIINILDMLDYEKTFKINKNNFIENQKSYNIFLEEIITNDLKPIDINEKYQKKINQKTALRNNALYELSISGGIGINSGISNNKGEPIFSIGPSILFDMETKIKTFQFNFAMKGTPLFNEALKIYDSTLKDKEKTILYYIFCNATFGGLFYIESIYFGGGISYSSLNFYDFIENNDYNSWSFYYETNYIHLLFFYLRFGFIAIKNIKIYFDIGSFLSVNDFFRYTPSFFPIYLNFQFRYIFDNNLFFDIKTPSFMLGINSRNGSSVISRLFFDIVVGYKIEWYKK